MTSSPKVSIVLPTHNGSERIRQTIDSCLNQTYRNIELIIVDDGSVDDTAQVITSFKDERIKYLRHKQIAGRPNSLNTGFGIAEGEYLTWALEGDRYLPSAIEDLTFFLKENKDIDLVYSDYLAHGSETDCEELNKMPDTLDFAKQNFLGTGFLFTRRAYEAVGYFDPRYPFAEDLDYWIRICDRFKAKHYPYPLYTHLENFGSQKNNKDNEYAFFSNILRYRYHYLSLSQLKKTFLKSPNMSDDSLEATASNLSSSTKFFLFIHLRNTIQISRGSLSLCLFYLLLLFRLTITTITQFFIKFLLVIPYEYAIFFFSLKLDKTHLEINAKRKNVLCIVPHLVMGGAEKLLINIAENTERRFSFHIITTYPSHNEWRERFDMSFQNIVVPFKGIKNPFYTSKAVYYKYIRHLVKELHIDIVLISISWTGYKYVPKLKSDFEKLKIIDIIHAENTPEIQTVDWLAPYIDRRICISNYIKTKMSEQYRKKGINDKYIKQLKVIHNGIDANKYDSHCAVKGEFKKRFSLPSNVKIISFLGRFSSEKNPLLFVEIAKNVIVRHPKEFKFVMAGDGPELIKVNNLIRDYKLKDHFILTGMLENVSELLNDSYILLVVSKAEGIPFAILEAMSMGVGVISTDVGAINEVVENNMNGFLVNPQNSVFEVVESFTSIISNALLGQTDYSKITKSARETVLKGFTLTTMTAEYQNIFEELTKEDYYKKKGSYSRQKHN